LGAIRTAARALIFRQGSLLLAHCRDEEGDWYVAPGGGQVEGESLPETLVRECREELGTEVEVLGLRFVRDYIVANHSFSYLSKEAHQLELFFECRVPENYRPVVGPDPDSQQVGVVWADAETLRGQRVYPGRLRDLLDPALVERLPVYWGDGD
jgi:8-oxo-dGTP pyrophosphatase MutT (NUDIX family)